MKKILMILILAFCASVLLTSCASSRNDCDCPKNVTDKRKPPKSHKNGLYKKR